MHTLTLGVLFVGAICLANLQRERFPDFRPDEIQVTVDYPSASPTETEQSICLKVEEAIRPIVGIERINSLAEEGRGTITARLAEGSDRDRVLSDVRAAVAQLSTLPANSERPIVRLAVRFRNVISVGVLGPLGLLPPPAERGEDTGDGSADTVPLMRLRHLSESIRTDLLAMDGISHVDLWHARPYQLDVVVSEAALRKFDLTHADVRQAIRDHNVDVPAGDIRTRQGDLLVRIDNKKLTADGLRTIPVVARADGTVLRLADVADVHDGFADMDGYARIDGRPALSMEVRRTSEEDMVSIHRQVVDYVAGKKMPPGYDLITWNDYSKQARERIDLLSRNAVVGLMLVFGMLAVFLDLRLAFWVAVGIPVSVLGTAIVMSVWGATINMHSMFAFVMALGIVVDDAIVISENIYRHRRQGADALQAAVQGTAEVAPSVITSVLTTVIAFLPLAYVSGEMGKWISVIPLALISMLLISLLEGLFVLPCHLSRLSVHPSGWVERGQERVQAVVSWCIRRAYRPCLSWSLRHPLLVVSSSVSVLCLVAGLYLGGYTPLVTNQQLNYEFVYAYVEYPKGTPTPVIDQATRRMESALTSLHPTDSDDPLVKLMYRAVGHHYELDNMRGDVYAELDSRRAYDETSSRRIVNEWRKRAGAFPGAERVVFWGLNNAPGGRAIELSIRSGDIEGLDHVTEAIKKRLRSYNGVTDIYDSRGPGKWEIRLQPKPAAADRGVPLAKLAETVRGAFHGDEAMRLQRGRHEVKVMVRYSRDERRRRQTLQHIRVADEHGMKIPLLDMVRADVRRGYAGIQRIDQQRAVTITADVDESTANAGNIAADLEQRFLPTLLNDYPQVRVRWEGQQRETRRSVSTLFIGLGAAIFGMFWLLTLEFRTVRHPLIVLLILPFGFVGAILGHLALGQPFTLFSLFGIVTLSGVVANDSIVLIDFANRRRREGASASQAVLDAGLTRFRPVMLTTLTTIAALLPILWERNTQAQALIPMAVSIACGLAVATVWVLVLGPVLYQLAERLTAGDATPD